MSSTRFLYALRAATAQQYNGCRVYAEMHLPRPERIHSKNGAEDEVRL
jgi:hypothetical protein